MRGDLLDTVGRLGALWELAVGQGGRRGCPALFWFVVVVEQGTRGPWRRVQKREGSEGNTEVVAVWLGTVLHSAALLPPAAAPATCSTQWPQELQLVQMV